LKNRNHFHAPNPGFMKKLFSTWLLKIFIVISGLQLAVCGLFAQVTGIGQVEYWEKTGNGVSGITTNAYFQVRVYNDNIIRVTVSLAKERDDFSYVLNEGLITGENEFVIKEDGNSIRLTTSGIDMELEKIPAFRVIFRNKDGKVINEDVAGEGFGTSYFGYRSTIYKKLFPDERFVGLGEVLGNLDHRGSAFTLNNTDTYKYGDPRMPMYVSIPFYIGIHDEEVYGLFYHNTYKTFFNFGISTPGFSSITAEGGDVDYFFIYDENIEKIIGHYTFLTGRMPLPPSWSLGYHQSRCSYFPQSNVKILAETFRAKNIPIDCIVLDADYLLEYEPFRINTQRFPDLPGLTSYLKSLDIEVTASVNPGIKVDSTYFAHSDGLEKDVFVKFFDGSLYTADIAPSTNNFVDFTNPKAREWWADNMRFLPENGIYGYWNDMNEPAVGGSYLPDNLLFDFDGRKANALEAKNLYGMLMARSSFESAVKYGGARRPFVLTRSGFAGVQRFAAVWTGDNMAKDDYLLGGTLLNTQLGLSGLAFVGDDIGGYIGNTTKELFIRWIEVGVFQPFARNHKEAFSNANEPWSYGEEAEAIAKEYIGFRYCMMPYLYSKFYECTRTGMPIVRSLCINDPFDKMVYDGLYQHQFLCGDAILIVPVTSAEKVKKFYLPAGDWYDLYSDELLEGKQELTRECGLYEIPLFVKASSIIPMQSLVQSTKQKPSDTLFVHIYNGFNINSFEYYEDDGSTMDYQKGSYFKRTITFDPGKNQVVLSEPEGSYSSVFKNIKCVFHGFEKIEDVSVNGKKVEIHGQIIKLLDGLRYLEDIYDPGYYKGIRQDEERAGQLSLVFKDSNEIIKINWKE
jgi:alpha-glucosidase